MRQLRTGRLTVAANELTCLYLLPLLHEYRRLYPSVHVTVQRALASRIPGQVLDYGADIGVVTFRPDLELLTSIVVYRDELAFVVPPTHPLARPKVSIEELARESFVAHHVSSPYRQRVIETFQTSACSSRCRWRCRPSTRSRSSWRWATASPCCRRLQSRRELAPKELVRVRVPDLAFERKLRLVYRREATLSHAAQAFLAVVEAQTAVRKGRFAFTAER